MTQKWTENAAYIAPHGELVVDGGIVDDQKTEDLHRVMPVGTIRQRNVA